MIRFHIETLGCQMNVLDSELAAAELVEAGFEPTDNKELADIRLFNTCSIRQHAEDKVYSALGRLKPWKSKDSTKKILGILGCMAQKDQDLIFKRAPHVDLVLGPGQLAKLPTIVQEIYEKRGSPNFTIGNKGNSSKYSVKNSAKYLEISLDRKAFQHEEVKGSFEQFDPHRLSQVRRKPFQAMVRVMFGCDKFCTYCVVPSVRGPEQSRPPQEIEEEIRILADQGVVEITLIGQTVNSYRYKQGETTVRLADLLEKANAVDGVQRVRFVTNYPRGMDDELLHAVRDLEKVAPYFHVPAQSGSDSVLRRMKRNYTAQDYQNLLQRITETVPGAAITSDFIVGFCGETEEEFLQTKELVRSGRFKNSFIFKYSERSGTKAAELYSDDISEEVKKRRNNELLEVQDEISLELNREFVGKTVRVLFEDENTLNAENKANIPTLQDQGEVRQILGRTDCDRIVACSAPQNGQNLIGQFVDVQITEALPFTLLGTIVNERG